METTVTNEMIYKELKNFKDELQNFKAEMKNFKSEIRSEFHDFKTEMRTEFQNFKIEVTTRFDKLENQIDHIETRINFIEHQHLEDNKILMDLWKERHTMKIGFSKTFFGIGAFISATIAVIVSIFTGKALSADHFR